MLSPQPCSAPRRQLLPGEVGNQLVSSASGSPAFEGTRGSSRGSEDRSSCVKRWKERCWLLLEKRRLAAGTLIARFRSVRWFPWAGHTPPTADLIRGQKCARTRFYCDFYTSLQGDQRAEILSLTEQMSFEFYVPDTVPCTMGLAEMNKPLAVLPPTPQVREVGRWVSGKFKPL